MAVLATRFRRSMALLLFGPVIATLHFLAVYLFAEVACHAGWLRFDMLGVPAIAFLTLVFTVATAALTGALSRVAYAAREGEYGNLAFTGFLLGVLFTIGILFVGVPPVFLAPCL